MKIALRAPLPHLLNPNVERCASLSFWCHPTNYLVENAKQNVKNQKSHQKSHFHRVKIEWILGLFICSADKHLLRFSFDVAFVLVTFVNVSSCRADIFSVSIKHKLHLIDYLSGTVPLPLKRHDHFYFKRRFHCHRNDFQFVNVSASVKCAQMTSMWNPKLIFKCNKFDRNENFGLCCRWIYSMKIR